MAERQAEPAVFYSDFPYCQQDSPDADYLTSHRLRPVTWDQDISAKERLIKGYRSQVGALEQHPAAGGRVGKQAARVLR